MLLFLDFQVYVIFCVKLDPYLKQKLMEYVAKKALL